MLRCLALAAMTNPLEASLVQLCTKLMSFFLVVGFLSAPVVMAKEKKRSKSKKSRKVSSKKSTKGDFVIEKRSDGTTVKYKKKTSYDFEGSDIEGLYKRPSGSYISTIKDVKGKPIIRIRKNFDAEVLESPRFIK